MAELSPDLNLSHYRIISKLGAGGMGEVYLAEDTRLHRKVALKILPADLASNQDRVRRYETKKGVELTPDSGYRIYYLYAVHRLKGNYAQAVKELAKLEPLMETLHSDPRWNDLERRVGLSQ